MRFSISQQSIDEYMNYYFGYSLNELLAPIGDNQVGESVRHNGVYFNIKEAREADDPTLPQGVWTHELKTADWCQVKQIALDALAHKSKDIQLGVWLFEANIHIDGFAGIAPAILLIEKLCDQFWPIMHPEMIDGDIEYHTNPLNWLNDKLTPVLGLLPITMAKLDGQEYNWNDWEDAQYYDKLKTQQQQETAWDGPTPQVFKQRLAATPSNELIGLVNDIEDGLKSIQQLQGWLDNCCGNDSPSLSDMNNLLCRIQDMLINELQRRGVSYSTHEANDKMLAASTEEDSSTDPNSINNGSHSGDGSGPIRDRSEAFVCLRKAADFLMNDDPHSPVPYLVYTACEWGEKLAPDLYQELFLTKGGQLNIFEMMGLTTDVKN